MGMPERFYRNSVLRDLGAVVALSPRGHPEADRISRRALISGAAVSVTDNADGSGEVDARGNRQVIRKIEHHGRQV